MSLLIKINLYDLDIYCKDAEKIIDLSLIAKEAEQNRTVSYIVIEFQSCSFYRKLILHQ